MSTLIEKNQFLVIKRIFLVVYDIIAVIAASMLALVIRFEGNYTAIPRAYIVKSLQ